MPSSTRCSRREFARAAVGGLFAGSLAGCTEDDSAGRPTGDGATAAGQPTETAEPAASGSTPTADATTEPAADGWAPTAGAPTADPTLPAGELDLREANVVGVDAERRNGRYRFSVALHHDDDGEAGYANWWQLERRDGARLGRRELRHPHSRQPFTRSETIEVPDDAECVVVRGHDETHGYGGRAAVVTVETGETRAVRQGPEPADLAGTDCP